MRKIILLLVGVLVIALIGLAALPFLIPASTYKNVIEARLEDALGREVTFESDPQIKFFPQLGVSLEGVRIENADGFSEPYFAKADKLDVAVKLIPLFSKRVEIAAADFQGAEILLEELANGENNWTFTSAEPNTDDANGPGNEAGPDSGSDFEAIIPKASLSNSRIKYSNDAEGVVYDISEINMEASLTGMDAPASLNGSLALNGETIRIRADISSLKSVMESMPFETDVRLDSDYGQISFDGGVEIAQSIQPTGNLSISTNKLSDLANIFEIQLPASSGNAFKALSADLSFSSEGDLTRMIINELTFDDITATGSIGVDLSTTTPYLDLDLTIPELIVTPYLAEGTEGNDASDPTDGWSEEPIDLSALRAINADLNLEIGRLANDRAEILDVVFTGKLENGKLTGRLQSSAPEGGRSGTPKALNPLYSGSLVSDLTLQSRENGQNYLVFDAEGSGIAAAALVKFFTGQDVLQGVASIDANAKSYGRSMDDIVGNLSGSYAAGIDDGAILGINLPQLLRSAQEALTTGKLPAALSPGEKTDFTSLTLEGDLNSGVAEITLFELLNPLLRADATGTVNLHDQTLDIRILPKALPKAAEDGSGAVKGFGIPLRVSGSWSNIKGGLDTEYLGQLAAEQAQDRLKDELSKRLGGDAGGLIDGIFGGGNDPRPQSPSPENEDDSAERQTEEDPAEQILRGIFGGRDN